MSNKQANNPNATRKIKGEKEPHEKINKVAIKPRGANHIHHYTPPPV